ncbi:MAG: hypothetical protein LUG18_11530, partial [Candidatus Azobacteroides sp.]|nr:hypothetical protein [Candidatus Azobacteroides sp.]
MFEVWRDLPFFINLSNFFRYAKLRENSSQGVETSRKSPHLRSLTKVASGILVARSFKPHVCKALHEKHIPVITHYAAPDVKPRHFYG